MKMKNNEIYFRASQVGKLLTGSYELWSLKDQEKMDEFEARKDGTFKTDTGRKGQYTKAMERDHGKLIKKFEDYEKVMQEGGTNLQLGQTGKTYVEDTWLLIEYGFKKEVMTKQLLKGIMTEQDCFDLISQVHPHTTFREKCPDNYKDDYFSGHPDVVLPDLVEDAKSSWSIETFLKVKTYDPDYYAQAQVYMHLTGIKKFCLRYCLVDTPSMLVDKEKGKFRWMLRDGAENPFEEDFNAICDQIDKNHKVSHIDPKKRVKTFEFDYDPQFILRLKDHIDVAREYYSTITLEKIELPEPLQEAA